MFGDQALIHQTTSMFTIQFEFTSMLAVPLQTMRGSTLWGALQPLKYQARITLMP